MLMTKHDELERKPFVLARNKKVEDLLWKLSRSSQQLPPWQSFFANNDALLSANKKDLQINK